MTQPVFRIIVAASAAAMFSFLLFLAYQVMGITGGDSGDLVAAAAVFGIPHPPGYPLYTYLTWLFLQLPGMTAAWKASFLSSLPSAITIGILFVFSYRLTRNFIPGFITALVLAGNYVFFLYSISPEVFSLLNFFLVLSTGLFFLWMHTGKVKYLYGLALTLGLGMTHHHLLLFILPAMVLVGWRVKERRVTVFRNIGILVVCALFGLLPYLYVVIAGHGTAIINWDRPVTVQNFIRLITRADYGTFQSGAFYLGQFGQRLLQVKIYFELVYLDIRLVGGVAAVVGWIWLRVKQTRVWQYVTIALITYGPWFFFYAGFPLANRFTLGTYERFLLPSYLFLSLLIGIGIWQIIFRISAMFSRFVRVPKPLITGLVLLVFLLYPLSILSTTLWRFTGIRTDMTGDRLGMDILQTVPQNGILLMGRDTPLFNTQYVRYGNNFRSDVFLLHGTLFESDYYPAVIRNAYPDLVVPEIAPAQFAKAFINANAAKHEIYSNLKVALDPEFVWVPYGLLYRLMNVADIPGLDELIAENDRLWSSYQNPRTGILSRYHHLMLSDVLDVYTASRNEFTTVLLRVQKYAEARAYAQAAVDLGGDSQLPQAYVNLGLAEASLKNCTAALTAFEIAEQSHIAPHAEILGYKAITYRDCVGDAEKAKEYFAQYDAAQKASQTKLAP